MAKSLSQDANAPKIEAKNAIVSPSTHDLVYFVDGSALPRLETSAAAVVHMNTTKRGTFRWETTSFLVRQHEAVCVDEAELSAMAGALVMAVLKVKGQHQMRKKRVDAIHRVLIFSDSQAALRQVQHWQHHAPCRKELANCAIARRIVVNSRILAQLHVQVTFHWVPGHARVMGNMRADAAARRMAKGRNSMASGCFFEDHYARALKSSSKNDDMVSAAQPGATTASIAKSRISMAFDPIQQCYVFCTATVGEGFRREASSTN
ncbi:uncharacterized protein F5Z01DRAFT_633779 [Emericellopsis atlantica]|uniref:RNase H type-1 domain-containing protein n=1 Tax=Emericellopsis atlantica TaxID=2614577 RepID=A0A9P7ZRQ7_9HYPO|nr:uncharacterized protein F5Z01DRAFT_633779 [Emericellopsis atlantica]KAG9257005.1 hypothetical protein F5Z01DRAFT_633779 [Emericellopsis atlantica]